MFIPNGCHIVRLIRTDNEFQNFLINRIHPPAYSSKILKLIKNARQNKSHVGIKCQLNNFTRSVGEYLERVLIQ